MVEIVNKLKSVFPFLSHGPRVVQFMVVPFVLACAIMSVIGIMFFGIIVWIGSDYGDKARVINDSVLPIFSPDNSIGQFIIQAVLGVIACAIIGFIFILLYNTLIGILGEED